jgi:hypothetical protein
VSGEQVRAAEADVERARGKLLATLHEVSRQFEPHRLIQEVWETAKVKGADLAEDAVDAVSRRPVATGAVIAGIVAFLARGSLIDLAGKLTNGTKEKRRTRKRTKAPKTQDQTEKA